MEAVTNIIIRVFCPKAGPSLQAEKSRLQFCRRQVSTANSGTKAAVLLGIYRCSSFPLLSAPHSLSLFSIWTDLKRSEKIQGAPTRRWGEWIWLTGSSGLHRNSPQGLNISSIRVFDQIRDPEIPINLRPRYKYSSLTTIWNLRLYKYMILKESAVRFSRTLYI